MVQRDLVLEGGAIDGGFTVDAELVVAPTAEARARVLELLRRYGEHATSFQGLEGLFQYWFPHDGACVAFVDTGSTWVAAGAPIAAREEVADVGRAFVEEARRHGRRASFFAAEAWVANAMNLRATHIGNQPHWDLREWRTTAERRSVRDQVRRARTHGVTVRRLSHDDVCAPETRAALDDLAARWLATKPMPPMGFLVDVELHGNAHERRYFVASHEDRPVAAAIAVPVYARGGWFIEDIVRLPSAPNGAAELLIDAAFRDFAATGCGWATLGMVPLSGVRGWLRWAATLSRPLYDFRGLEAFRRKLHPTGAEPLYLIHPRASSVVAIVDALRAFARGSLFGFALRTFPSLFRRKQLALPRPGEPRSGRQSKSPKKKSISVPRQKVVGRLP